MPDAPKPQDPKTDAKPAVRDDANARDDERGKSTKDEQAADVIEDDDRFQATDN